MLSKLCKPPTCACDVPRCVIGALIIQLGLTPFPSTSNVLIKLHVTYAVKKLDMIAADNSVVHNIISRKCFF